MPVGRVPRPAVEMSELLKISCFTSNHAAFLGLFAVEPALHSLTRKCVFAPSPVAPARSCGIQGVLRAIAQVLEFHSRSDLVVHVGTLLRQALRRERKRGGAGAPLPVTNAIRTTFRTMRSPWSADTDSGWACSPKWRRSDWLAAIATASETVAVSLKRDGIDTLCWRNE